MGHQFGHQATGGSQLQHQHYSLPPAASYQSAAPAAQAAHHVQASASHDSFTPISPASVAGQQPAFVTSPPHPAFNEAAAPPNFISQQYNSAPCQGSAPIDAKPTDALPQPVYGQSAHGTPTTPLSAQHGSPYDAGRHSVPSSGASSSGYSSNESQASAEAGQRPAAHFANPDAQQSPSMSDMGMQFMRAMHMSVTQVIDEPHFGFEWVKPDYQFDGLVDADELADALSTTPGAGSPVDGDAESPRSKSSRRSSGSGSGCSDSDAGVPLEAPATSDAGDASSTAALTPKAMEELYDELEKYSEFYCQ